MYEKLWHTGLIGSKSFRNYAFKGCISLETLKLWLLLLKKITFLMATLALISDISDIEQHFHTSEKICSFKWVSMISQIYQVNCSKTDSVHSIVALRSELGGAAAAVAAAWYVPHISL